MPNYDEKTFVFYGVIGQGSIAPEASDSIYFSTDSIDLNYENWKQIVRDSIAVALKDLGSDDEIQEVANTAVNVLSYTGDEVDPEYKDFEGYHIIKCLDTDLMILHAPYVTWAPPCSPCVPAAGNLDDAIRIKNHNKHGKYLIEKSTGMSGKEANKGINPQYGDSTWRITFCLGPDWFEDEKAPYPYAPIDENGIIGEWVFPETEKEE